MIKRKLKQCYGCQEPKIIWSKNFCKRCYAISNSKRKENVPKKNGLRPIKKVGKKPSGEIKIFREIWEERPHACQVCGVTLPIFDHWNFMHVLSKGAYNLFRLLKINIVLACRKCHNQYDNGSTKDDPKFQWVLELKQKLKQLYYEKNNLAKD